jgi:F-type H+-transporting ATPase subunit b
MFMTPDFWVFIAFVLFIGGIGKKALSFLKKSLDEHSNKVAHQLEEAQRLHDEALKLLNSYKIKHQEAIEQANKIIAFAESEALEFKKTSEQAFEKLVLQKESALRERLAIENEEAKAKLQKQAVDEAFAIVERVLLKEQKLKENLTKSSLKKISTLAIKPTIVEETLP